MDETTRAGHPAVKIDGGACPTPGRAISLVRRLRIPRLSGTALACVLTVFGGLSSPPLAPSAHAQQRPSGEPPRGRIVVDRDTEGRALGDLPPGISAGTVGTMTGAVSVGASGGVGWSTQLWTPTGVGGMEPSLGISYGGTGYGALGVGFSLSGESSISRCARTLGQDGRDSPITWTTSDALCLDGVRLVPVKGEQGKQDTEYRLQTSPNTRVVALWKDSTSEYSGFGVYTGDGRVTLYGVQIGQSWTQEGMQYARRDGKRVPLSWHITRARDARSGNEMHYRYGGEAVDEEGEITPRDFHLQTIQYGINETASAAASRQVIFEYRPVQDVLGVPLDHEDDAWVHEGYVAGQHYVRIQVLSQVAMEVWDEEGASWSRARHYKIGYESVPQLQTKLDAEPEDEPEDYPATPLSLISTSDRVRVRALQECGRGSVSGASCFWPTLFEYSAPADALVPMPGFGWNNASFYPQPDAAQLDTLAYPRVAAHLTGDFDADGDLDMLVMPEWANEHLLPANHDWSQGRWELWETDADVHGPQKTNVKTWSTQQWVNRAGTVVPSVGAITIGFGDFAAPRPPDPVRKGHGRDAKAPPMAFTINFDGSGGTDVLVGEPVVELAGFCADTPWGAGCRTSSARRFATDAHNDPIDGCWSNPSTWEILTQAEFDACWDDLLQSKGDYTAHPGVMRGFKVLRHAPTSDDPAHFSETSLNYTAGEPVFWMHPADLNGDSLTDLIFCKADADYAAAAGKPLPMFYGADSTFDPVNWVSGTVHYVLNAPNSGLDLSFGGIPATDDGLTGEPIACHAKDTYFAFDLYGDGRQSLMHRKHPHAKQTTIPGIAPTVPVHPLKDPYPYDPSDTGLIGYWEKLKQYVGAKKTLGGVYYDAFTYTMGKGMHHGETTLPLEQFMLWHSGGNMQARYSTHQASAVTDEDGGMALSESRDGRLTDWGDPSTPMVGGGKPSDVRTGDINGDGLEDVLMVDLVDCFYEQKGLTEDDLSTFEDRTCSYQDVTEFGLSLMEQTFEKLAVFVYLNRGDGSFELGSVNHLWDTDLNPKQVSVLRTGTAPGLSGKQIKETYDDAWTIATRATRTWRAEFASSIIGDGNGDGLADLGYIQLALKPLGGWNDDTMSGFYRLRPIWRLARHGGRLADNRTPMGLPLVEMAPDSAPTGWPPHQESTVLGQEVVWELGFNSPAVATPYEQHAYGLAARLMQLDVDQDGKLETAFYDHVRSRYLLARQTATGEPQPHLLTAVTDGLGARTEVDYAPQWTLTDPATPWTAADAALPYPLWQRPSVAAAAMQLRTDTGQDDGDKPRYNTTQYLYGKSRSDVRLGIGLGIERTTVEQTALTSAGAVNRRVTTRYDVAPNYDPNFKAYPLAGSMLSTTAMAWGADDASAALTHSVQRHSAHAGQHPGTWRRRIDVSDTRSFEIGDDLTPAKRTAFMACLIEGSSDCTAGPQPSYAPLSQSTSTNTYDPEGYGLLESQMVESAGTTTVTETVFEHRDPATLPNQYLIGLPTRNTVAHEPTPDAGFTLRTSENAYDSTGRLKSTTIEPEQPAYRSKMQYTYGAFGQVHTQTLSATDIAPATTTFGYSASGAYQTSITNALGHTAVTDWYEGCGKPERSTNPLGHTVVSDIDGFCRDRSSQAFFGDVPLNRRTEILLDEWMPDADEAYPDHEVLVTTQVEGGASSYTMANRIGQTVVTQGQAFGFETYTQAKYDVLGRPVAISPPTKVGEQPIGWTTTTYDGRGRPTAVTRPDGTTQTTRYDRYLTEVTNEMGHTGSSRINALGQVVRVTPPADPEYPEQKTAMCYRYGAFGTLTRAEPCTNTAVKDATTLQYDDYGRLTQSHDAQAGVRITRYDALGRVHQTEDALGQITQHEYDVLGRLSRRTEAFGTPEAKTAMWDYDKIAPGVLTQAINADGTVAEEPLLDEVFRLAGSRTTIHGRAYEQHQTFDNWGRPSSTKYPSLSFLAPVTAWTKYNDFDQPIEQYANGQLLWEPVHADVWGLTEQRYGDGVLTAHATYDPLTGRLQDARTDRHVVVDGAPQSYPIEHFTYDWYDHGLIQRRTQKALLGNETDQVDQFRYTPRGELHSWSTIGKNGALKHNAMAYDGFGKIVDSDAGHHTYFAEKLLTVNGPHGNVGYTYTGNGAVLTRTHAGVETTLGYNALGRVDTIDAPGAKQRITYSASGAKAHVLDEATGRETYYVGAYQEERGGELASKGQVIGRYALGAAHLTRTWTQATLAYTDALAYTPPADHLGSTTLVTDATGNATDRRAYDPWGNERDPNDWTQFKAAPKDDVLTPATGYTGHHERRQFGATAPGISGLIDMHTRYYDPFAKRFLQQDGIIPDVFNPLSWDRSAYVDNNPANFSDPLGMAKAEEEPDYRVNPDGSSILNGAELVENARSGIDGSHFSNSVGMPGTASAPTGDTSGEILATMRAGRNRMAAKVMGAQNATRYRTMRAQGAPGELNDLHKLYLGIEEHPGLFGQGPDDVLPWSSFSDFVDWYRNGGKEQIQKNIDKSFAAPGLASSGGAAAAASIAGGGGGLFRRLFASRRGDAANTRGGLGRQRSGAGWRWPWQSPAPRSSQTIVADAVADSTLAIARRPSRGRVVDYINRGSRRMYADGQEVAEVVLDEASAAVIFTESRFASVANARAAFAASSSTFPHLQQTIIFNFDNAATAQAFHSTLRAQGDRLLRSGHPVTLELSQESGVHYVGITTTVSMH